MTMLRRQEEELPLDATIVTFLRGSPEKKKDDAALDLLKKWADGKGRPHDGSAFLLKTDGKRVFPEYV